ncbi:Detected protein of confused Function [Hibiscus syriacus]|uniref:Detected protein of confused Function n=1 Tax=Hibiscus syriacus TaxID=106335 RepID=A0A6A3D6Y9_HIBSY|nr:Detected protein of confused Function [Hibiscus syriacus]
MGNEGLVLGCLYFFEWMHLQEPSLVTPRACSIIFPVLGRSGLGDKLMVLFRNLPQSKGFRDIHVYNAAISGLLSSKRYRDAREVYAAMESNNVEPDHVTCSMMITAIRKTGGLKNEALIIQSEMEKKGVHSNTVVYNTLMDAYGKLNQIEEVEAGIVEELLVQMQDMGLKPDVKSYTCLIGAYGRQKKMSDRAADAFLRMKKVGLKPTSHSYTSLIHAYSISGDSRGLMKVWKLMIKEKIEGTRVTFNILLDGFAKQDGENGQVPDVKSYEKLRSILDVKAAKQNKRDKSAIMGIINSKMGMVKAKRKTKKDEFWKNKKKDRTTAANAGQQ